MLTYASLLACVLESVTNGLVSILVSCSICMYTSKKTGLVLKKSSNKLLLIRIFHYILDRLGRTFL